MTQWQEDKFRSDRFLPEIKGILGLYLIGEAPYEDDARRNTDLIVLRMDAVRIACRIRKFEYLARYGDQFTIRAGRPSGNKTELAKIIEGWGDYFFYGFEDGDSFHLSRWTLADLRVFRIEYMRKLARMNAGEVPGMSRQNGDGSSNFDAFRWSEFSSDFIIASSVAPNKEAAA